MKGYIKLHRKALESAVFQNARLWQVWCWALIRANHKIRKMLWNGRENELQPGQFISGRFAGAKECNMPASTFWDQIRKLREMGNLDIRSDNRNTVFTVVNWAEYQVKKESPTANPTTGRQLADTDKNVENGKNDLQEKRKDTEGRPSDALAGLIRLLPDLPHEYAEQFARRCLASHNPVPLAEVQRLLSKMDQARIIKGIRKCVDQGFWNLRKAIDYETVSFFPDSGVPYPSGDDPDPDHSYRPGESEAPA